MTRTGVSFEHQHSPEGPSDARRAGPGGLSRAAHPRLGSSGGRGAQLADALARLDAVIDVAFEPLRGRAAADSAAAVLSNLADYGVVWVLVAGWKARRPGPRRWRAVAALGTAGVSSLLVNTGLKAVIRRERPDREAARGRDGPVAVRAPSSTSFPSGHTLASTCTAVLLAEGAGETALYLSFATAVAASRVHLGDHHGSDVVGGMVIGALLGAAGRRVLVRCPWGDRAPWGLVVEWPGTRRR